MASLPPTMQALVIPAVNSSLTLQTVPTPTANPGSAIVKILATTVDTTLPHRLTGHGLTFPTPHIPGNQAVGRIVAVGPDAARLQPGQLVLLECFVRARDDPTVELLWGTYDGPTTESKRFMKENWADAMYAEYARAPLENCHVLDEGVLCGRMGYKVEELLPLATMLVAFGGLSERCVGLRPGQRVVIAPATGVYSGAAVPVALAMGASVVAVGRDLDRLRGLKEHWEKVYPGRIEVVQNTGDADADAASMKQFGPVDVFFDLSPYSGGNSTHIRSGIMSVRQYGRVVLMGPTTTDIPVTMGHALWNNLTIKAQYMYERDAVRRLIQMAEAGVIKLGKQGGWEVTGSYKLNEMDKALEQATKEKGFGKFAVFKPSADI